MSLMINCSEFQEIAGLKFSDRVRKMRTGAKRECLSEKKNDDDLASTSQLLNGAEMRSFSPKLSGIQFPLLSYHKSKHNTMFPH